MAVRTGSDYQYKRQTLNIFGIIHKYLVIKKASPEERKKIQPWTFIFAGKAAPGKDPIARTSDG